MVIQGKTALLTGASKGLGRELALALDHHGCRLLLVARDSERLGQLQADLQTPGSRIYPGDLADAQDRANLIQQILDQESRLDLIIHCAGVGSHSTLAQLQAAEVNQVLELNMVAPLAMTTALLPLLPRSEKAGIVNIGSVAGELITPGMSLYSASKHALHAFSRAADIELAAQNHFCLLVILGALRNTHFGESIRNPASGQPGWYRRMDVDADKAAQRIVAAITKERRQLVIPGWYRPLFALSRLLAPVTRWVTQSAFRRTVSH